MSDAERIKRFLKDGHERNLEIYENLIELRGEYRAKVTSELCNIRCYMTALIPCTCFPNIAEAIMQTGVALTAVMCKEHSWNVHEVTADIDMMFKARALEK